MINQARLSGVLVQRSELRYTPSGVAVLELEIDHQSTVLQAGSERSIMFTVEARVLGDVALAVHALVLGKTHEFAGFWAPLHHKTKRLGFHVLSISA